MLLRHLPQALVAGLVAASIRPEQHDKLARCAAAFAVPLLLQPRRGAIDYPAFVEQVRLLAPDFLIVNSYSMRISTEILQQARFGGINVHGGLLPKFRGANPIQWALIADERETGVTMHYLSEEIDAGPIVAQRKVPIFFRDTWRDVWERINRATEVLLSESLSAVLHQKAHALPQNPAEAGYYRRRTSEDGSIDWTKRVLDLYNLIRALVEPHPGAFYQSAAGRVWIRHYMSIQEVAALKYSMLQNPPIAVSEVQFEPKVAGKDNFVSDKFSLAGNAGRMSLVNIDWEERVALAEIAIESSRSHLSAALQRELNVFAEDQLGLRVLSTELTMQGDR